MEGHMAFGAIIHIPQEQKVDPICVMKQMKNIYDGMHKNATIINENWIFKFDDDLPDLNKAYFAGTNEWKESPGWENFSKRRPFACLFYFSCAEVFRTQAICAYFFPKSEYDRDMYGIRDVGITVTCESSFEKYIDETEFKNVIKKAAIELNATYACIDKWIPSNGFYHDQIRDYSKNPHTIDPETLLPGIHWACLISPGFVKNTGTLEEIQKTIPCEIAELIEGDKEPRLWFEITSDRKKTNYKKRLALRRYFQESIYQISLEDLVKKRRVQNWNTLSEGYRKSEEKLFKLIPLTADEIDAIKNETYPRTEKTIRKKTTL